MSNLVTCGLAAFALGLSASAALADATFTLQNLSNKAANESMLRGGGGRGPKHVAVSEF